MKSKLFGFNAKMALAALVVCGAFTSCYEKEEVDATPTPTLPDPVYMIVGNLTNNENGTPVGPTTIKIDDVDVDVDANGYFEKAGLAAGKHTIVVDVQDFLKATRTVYLQSVDKGQTSLVVADFSLHGASSQVEEPEIDVPATEDEAKAAVELIKEDVVNEFSNAVGENLDGEVTVVTDNSGETTVTAKASVELEQGAALEVSVPSFTGFASTITPAYTRDVTFGQTWLASAEKLLNKKYGLQATTAKVTLGGVAGKTLIGYTIVTKLTNRTLQFDGVEGTVTYQEKSTTVEPLFESHDSHDAHGGNPGAGGGSSANN